MLIVYLKIAKMVNNSNISNHKIKSIAPPTIKLPRRVCDELCMAYALPILRHNQECQARLELQKQQDQIIYLLTNYFKSHTLHTQEEHTGTCAVAKKDMMQSSCSKKIQNRKRVRTILVNLQHIIFSVNIYDAHLNIIAFRR